MIRIKLLVTTICFSFFLQSCMAPNVEEPLIQTVNENASTTKETKNQTEFSDITGTNPLGNETSHMPQDNEVKVDVLTNTLTTDSVVGTSTLNLDGLIKQCDDSEGIVPFEVEGILVGNQTNNSNENLLDLSSNKIIPWFTTAIDSQAVGFSPNEQWYAHIYGFLGTGELPYVIQLTSITGESITYTINLDMVPFSEQGQRALVGSRWLNNTHIRIFVYLMSFEGDRPHIEEIKTALINVTTGQLEVIEEMLNLTNLSKSYQLYFSPDMTRVVYPVTYIEPKIESALILWDLEKDELIWEKRPFDTQGMRIAPYQIPDLEVLWAYDSSRFIVSRAASSELNSNDSRTRNTNFYIVNRNGEEVEINSPDFDELNSVGWPTLLNLWSPDSKSLLLINHHIIYLYDVDLDNFQPLCRWPNDDPNLRSSFNIFWLPDGDSFIYQMQFGGQPMNLYLMDLPTQTIYKVSEIEDYEPKAWLDDESWFQTP